LNDGQLKADVIAIGIETGRIYEVTEYRHSNWEKDLLSGMTFRQDQY